MCCCNYERCEGEISDLQRVTAETPNPKPIATIKSKSMKTKFYLFQIFMMSAATMLLCGCHSSPSRPSPSEAQKALSQEIQAESHGQIKLISFTKTDGQSFVEDAVQSYKMSYEALIEFEANGVWLAHEDDTPLGFTFDFHSGAPSDPLDVLQAASERACKVKHGQKIKIKGTITAEKTERGWKFDM